MDVEYKKSEVLEGLNLRIYRDNALIVGIGTQPIIKLSENKIDENMNFTWFLCGYGCNCFTIDNPIKLEDNVILTDFPKWRIVIEDNKETINHYKDLFVNLSKFDRTELNNRNKECNSVVIKEYFLIPSYMITATHTDFDLNKYSEKIKSSLKSVISENGLVIAKM
jgi:hypothetical protein